MRNFITLFFISLSFTLLAQDIDLFIWAGQSNALGRQGDAELYPEDTDNLDNQIRFNWTVANGSNSGGWTSMQPQIGYFPDGHFGPEVTFSRKLVQQGYNPAIFKFTQGGTSIFEHWQGPGDNGLYDMMITQLNTAIQNLEDQGHTVNIKGFVWIQGESDSNSQEAATAYFNNLNTLINDLRTNVIGNLNLPIILGVDEQYFNLVNHQQPEILNAHQDIANNDINSKFTSMYGYPKADDTHLTPAGLISHGEDIFDAYQQLVSGELVYDSCIISSTGAEDSFERASWGQTFKTVCSGELTNISFSAPITHNHAATFTLHNGTDCSGTVLFTQNLSSITSGNNSIHIDEEIYLNTEHTYFFQIVTDDDSLWRINYSNTDTVFGMLRTFQDGNYCAREFPNFDMDFSVELSSSTGECVLSSSGTEESFERASWGQSFKTACSGQLSSISFNAPSTHNSAATFTLHEGQDCHDTVIYSHNLALINSGENTINFDDEIILNSENTYYFQILTDDDSLWRINYSSTDNVFGVLRTYQDGDYCQREFPNFDMAFSVVVNNDGASCADESNIYSFVYNEKTYEIVKENKTWTQASSCAVERGGYLTEINNSAEQNAIYDQLENNAGITISNTVAPDGGNASYVWIGANDMDEEGHWVWNGDNNETTIHFWQGGSAASGGVPVAGLYSNWGNEPDNWNNQDAAGIALTEWPLGSGSLGSASQWNDVDHLNTLYYVIEYDTNLATNQNMIGQTKMYPNPVKGFLTIETDDTIKQITISNSLGQTIKQKSSFKNANKSQIDFSTFNNGIYFININYQNGKSIVKRIIK